MFYFGSHISINDQHNLNNSNPYISAAKNIQKYGGNFLQLFVTFKEKTSLISSTMLKKFNEYLLENNMKVVVHSSYTHNIAQNWDEYSTWIINLEMEIKYASQMGAIGVVLHFGKKLSLTNEQAYNNMFTSLLYIHNKTKEYTDVKIFLETPAGQGTEMCSKIHDLAYFYKKFTKTSDQSLKNRIKLCVDSCHVFNAGYNLKDKTNIKLFLETFEELIGINNIGVIHLNDSKSDIGEQIDRHAELGKGFIGINGLNYFFNYFKKLNIPIILETPDDCYKKEIKNMLKIN